MVKEQIKLDLIRHEGLVAEIYLDHLGYPTFGIGHLVTKEDGERELPVGTPVSQERIDAVFEKDFKIAYEDAKSLVKDLECHPDNVIRVLVNMAFNLGRTRLGLFRNFLNAVDRKCYLEAAEHMKDSKWYGQVGNRSKELVKLMRGGS